MRTLRIILIIALVIYYYPIVRDFTLAEKRIRCANYYSRVDPTQFIDKCIAGRLMSASLVDY